ncbi:MAG: hypothetical protein L6R42_006809, partial [Xanthoria sp. 1 TBL-2021]
NPGWLTIAGKFIAPYLKGQTEAFYGQYPSEASFPKPSVPPVDPTETEDCLFLDVKVSRNVISNKDIPNRKAPVLVWIHGGGFTGGYKTQYSSDSLLAQSRISRNVEVVFVQLNYRLGAFGFLSGVGVQGNVGLLDQRLALQWVQKHIDQFGGDPRQVTVMGESAGAGSIEYHLTARDAVSTQPLFQHAIMQSPFFFPDQGQGLGFTDPWVLSDVDFTDYVRKLFPAASLDAVSYITNTIYPPPKSARLPYETSFDRAVLVTSDVVITCNTYLLARAYQNKTYNYLFDAPPGLHGDDLHYTFGPDSSVR